MAATYLGSVSLAKLLGKVLDALASAKAYAQILVGVAGGLELSVMGELEADVQAAASASADVSLTDPFELIQGLLAASAGIQAEIALLDPSIFLQANVEASVDVSADVSAKFAAAAGLFGSLTDALAGLTAAVSLTVSLSSPGLHLLKYTGPLSSMGSDLNTVTPETGLAPATGVKAYVVAVDDTNLAASAEMTAFFEGGLLVG